MNWLDPHKLPPLNIVHTMVLRGAAESWSVASKGSVSLPSRIACFRPARWKLPCSNYFASFNCWRPDRWVSFIYFWVKKMPIKIFFARVGPMWLSNAACSQVVCIFLKKVLLRVSCHFTFYPKSYECATVKVTVVKIKHRPIHAIMCISYTV